MKNNTETEIIQVDDDKKVCIDGDDKTFRDHWVTEGSVILHLKDKQEILRGRELTDLQIYAFQNLLKRQCKHVDGSGDQLQDTKLKPAMLTAHVVYQIIWL